MRKDTKTLQEYLLTDLSYNEHHILNYFVVYEGDGYRFGNLARKTSGANIPKTECMSIVIDMIRAGLIEIENIRLASIREDSYARFHISARTTKLGERLLERHRKLHGKS